jgi:hypothetical protein
MLPEPFAPEMGGSSPKWRPQWATTMVFPAPQYPHSPSMRLTRQFLGQSSHSLSTLSNVAMGTIIYQIESCVASCGLRVTSPIKLTVDLGSPLVHITWLAACGAFHCLRRGINFSTRNSQPGTRNRSCASSLVRRHEFFDEEMDKLVSHIFPYGGGGNEPHEGLVRNGGASWDGAVPGPLLLVNNLCEATIDRDC